MDSIRYKNCLYEVYEIIKCINKKTRDKIPSQLIEYIKENKSINYSFTINKNMPIEEQELLPETEAFITIIYRDYICPIDEKKVLQKYIENSDLIFEEKLRQEYNPENLFKNKQKIQNLPIEVKKESFIIKIIDCIKKYLDKRKVK